MTNCYGNRELFLLEKKVKRDSHCKGKKKLVSLWGLKLLKVSGSLAFFLLSCYHGA